MDMLFQLHKRLKSYDPEMTPQLGRDSGVGSASGEWKS